MFKFCLLFACVVAVACAVEVRRDDKVFNRIVFVIFDFERIRLKLI